MFEPLTLADLPSLSPDTRIYCQPACFVERPHGLDGRVTRIGDGMVWFAAWAITVRGPSTAKREALVPVEAMPEWLAALPEPVAARATGQIAAVTAPRAPIALANGRTIRLAEPQVMGILNVTPDSFSDGGKNAETERAIASGVAMAKEGADILDVGGESTRPGSEGVPEEEELRRVIPVVEALAGQGLSVSVDTRKARVMRAALKAGAKIINDVAALAYDDRAIAVAAKAGCPVILMHAPSQKSDPHDLSALPGGKYADAALDVFDWLEARIAAVVAGGVAREKIIVDPGIGFGKGVEDNLRIINALPLYHALGCPLLFAASRKRFIGAVDGEAEAGQRLGGSVAAAAQAVSHGAHLIRAHDIPETRQALRLWRAMRDTALTRL